MKEKKEDNKKEELKELELAQKERDEYLNGWKRAKADLINFRKEAEQAMGELGDYVKADTLKTFLPVIDSLDESAKSGVEGLSQIRSQIKEIFKSQGVEEIETKHGDHFNPEIHEAVNGEGNKIEKVFQKGYKYKEKIIRPVKVELKK